MARTRRVGNRRSQAARNQENEESAVEEIDFDDIEEVDFEEGESDVVEPEPQPETGRRSRRGSRAGSRVGSSVGSASGRRSARMSSRRSSAGGSGRRSGKRSARTELTPEEIEAKRKARKSLLNLLIGLLLLGAAGFGIFWALKPNPLAAKADAELRTAKEQLDAMSTALSNLDPDRAQEIYDQVNNALRTPLFANGGDKINEDDPKLASAMHARRAKAMLEEFDETYARIDRVRERVLVENNLKMISHKLNNIDKLSDNELDELGRLIDGFRDNPLDPQLGDPSPIAQEEYTTLISRLTGKEQEVTAEKKRREDRRTTFVEKEVNSKVDKLMNQERFQNALDHIDEMSKNNPDAALSPIRDRVVATARNKWDVTRKNAEGKYADGTSATNNNETRVKSLKAAVEDMEKVIDKFGIEDYVREARELKTKYERALRNLDG